ncbi:phage baseplate assembly protein V [Lelliottia sp. SL45]|uniref:phage baseplate assembly protein V n=1 Tax=Lelliottia sp. SL45 TaxID=2994665 RepID=UPI0022737C9C|nr:phage baseplate assembly protein V [Lelliottia sp. SL45]MCY1697153.1 phage baseplate assembly protein V [Lelliottia sp. SL45]
MLQNVNNLEWDTQDLNARLSRMVQFGEVVRVDPKTRRTQVMFPALNGVTLWLQTGVRRALGVSAVHTYTPGEQVICLFHPSGDVTSGAVLMALHNDADAPWTDSADIEGVKYPDGSQFSYDMANRQFDVSLVDGSVAIRMTEAGIVVKGKVIFEDPVTCNKTLDAVGDISSQANIGAAGELSDKHGSVSEVRDTFNGHDHDENGDGGGTTDSPNQKM